MRASNSQERQSQTRDDAVGLLGLIQRAEVSAEDLLQRYAEIAFAQIGSLREVSQRLGISRPKLRELVGISGEKP